MTAKNLLSPFALEVHMKESGILNCPKEEKVDCNLGVENQVQNKHSFSAIFMFILQKVNHSICLYTFTW